MRTISIFLSLAVIGIYCACRSSHKQEELTSGELNDHIAAANQLMVHHEKEEIAAFISRHQFIMDSTGTGLRYDIYFNSQGEKPKPHDAVVVAYKVYFLNGTLVYDHPESSPDTFRLAEAQRPRGLEDALFQMSPGSKARLVLPSHLAYGMIGDQARIPGATPLYYDLCLLKINP